jgi:hypothetical protein
MLNMFKRKPKPFLDEVGLAKKLRKIHTCYVIIIVALPFWVYSVYGYLSLYNFIATGDDKVIYIDKVLEVFPAQAKTIEVKNEEPSRDEMSLNLLIGTPMEEAIPAIRKATQKWNVPAGLITGIAKIESGMGKHYFFPYDKDNCHNAWGIKPNTKSGHRPDGSWLRCFNSWDEGAEEIARLLKQRYFDAGHNTVEEIAVVYKCGSANGSKSCLAGVQNWINVVYKNGYF